MFLFFIIYHTSHVIMKIGRMSAPGSNSAKDTKSIQRNMNIQPKIPIMSNTSPVRGNVSTPAAYSVTSNITQKIRERSSISVKTKYRGIRTLPICFLGCLKKSNLFLKKITS